MTSNRITTTAAILMITLAAGCGGATPSVLEVSSTACAVGRRACQFVNAACGVVDVAAATSGGADDDDDGVISEEPGQ